MIHKIFKYEKILFVLFFLFSFFTESKAQVIKTESSLPLSTIINKKKSIFKHTDENTFKKSVLISIKTGYHSGYKLSLDNGFPEDVVFDGSIEFGLGKYTLAGINFDYWKKDNVVTHPSLTDITVTKYFKSFGYRFFFKVSIPIGNKVNLFGDIGAGRYDVISEWYEPSGSKSRVEIAYINFNLSAGIDYKINKFLYITGHFSLYALTDVEKFGTSVYKIKIGPTFFMRY